MVVALAAMQHTVGAAVQQAPPAPMRLFDTVIALDREFVPEGVGEAVALAAERFSQAIEGCPTTEAAAQERCVLERLLGTGALAPAESDSDPRQSTVSHALAKGHGSCAALVAAVLALAEGRGPRFEAVVLRDHVALASGALPGTFYELLEGGRSFRTVDIARYRRPQPGGPVRVDARGFLPYYLDNLGARLANAGDPTTAERVFDQALRLDASVARVHYNLGSFLVQRGRADEALRHLSRAIRLGWRDADVYANRGSAYQALGRSARARKDFEKAIDLDPDHASATRNLQRLEVETSHPPPADR